MAVKYGYIWGDHQNGVIGRVTAMAKVADMQQAARSWLTWGAILVLGVLVGHALPASSASPKSETGVATGITPGTSGSGSSFVFQTKGIAAQNLQLRDRTPWQAVPGGAWHSSGQPTCLVPGSATPSKVTLGLITVSPVGSAPGETIVAWVECGG